jgi:transcriptional regulatory protein LevR
MGLNYNSFIHKFRCDIFINNIPFIPINKLFNQKYTFIKFIMNPYIRAVSIFRSQTSHNLTFRQYLHQLVNNQIQYFNANDIFHLQPQYLPNEEAVITKYIKINENEKYTVKLHEGTNYEIDVNKYTSIHHGKKTDFNEFCGDMLKDEINKQLPQSYKCFYDDEIKNLVHTFYKNDVDKYKFTFDF